MFKHLQPLQLQHWLDSGAIGFYLIGK